MTEGSLDPMTVVLRNGTEEQGAFVAVTQIQLRDLFDEDPMVFYELVMWCRIHEYRISERSRKVLVERAIVEAYGDVHDSTCNIVLSMVDGESMEEMCLVSPVAN